MFRPSLHPITSRTLGRRYVWVSLMAGLVGTTIGGCAAEEVAGKGVASGCSIDSDCRPPLVCSFEKCHVGCRASSDCDNGARCVVSPGGGVCQLQQEAHCAYDTDCPSGLSCAADEQCRNECKSERDCAGGQVCTPSGSCADTTEVNSMGELHGAGDAGSSLGGGGSGGIGNGQSGSPGTGGSDSKGGAPMSGTDAGPIRGGSGNGGFGGGFGGANPGGMGPGGAAAGCGTPKMPCCPPGDTCTDTSTVCVFGMCQECGAIGSRCCASDACVSGGTCDNGTCVACGALSQPCCGAQCTGSLSCVSGTCDVTCSPPLVAKQGSCVLPAPRPIAPISGSNVNTRLPKLTWALPAGISTAHVQVCKDRACSNVLFETDAATSATVSSPLPAGIAFWRLSSVAAGDAGASSASYSPVWQVMVGGAHDAPISAAWGTAPDFNGDGFADVVARANLLQSAEIRTYLGASSGISSAPVTISNSGGGSPRPSLPVGDFDGDGYTDLAIQAGPGLEVHRGSPSGLAVAPSQQITNSSFGPESAQVTGDVNADGYSDLLVPTSVRDVDGNEFLNVGIFFGSSAGLGNVSMSIPTTVVRDPDSGGADTADVNGDGYTDLIVGSSFGGSQTATLSVFTGGPSGLSSPVNVTFTMSGGAPRANVSTAGDVNDDGYDDVLVQTGNSILQYLGGPGGLASTSSNNLAGNTAGGPGPAPAVVLGLGDANRDGYDDVVVVDTQQSIRVYLGSATGLNSGSFQLLSPPAPPSFAVSTALVTALSGIGDVNGDGYGDIGMGVEWTSTSQIKSNRAYVFHGGSPLPAAPGSTLSVAFAGIR